MALIETTIKGLYLIEPRIFEDERGYFFESFNQKSYEEKGIAVNFVQDNESFSTKGVLRGLHYQVDPKAQTKLVRVVRGRVLDVVVDLREDSETYGQQYSIILSGKNKRQLYVPKGFAHGYITLSKRAIFCYKCDEYYFKDYEAGIMWNDPKLNIDWKLPSELIILSEKDKSLPSFENHKKFAI